jgi:DNA repair exonuclease SbcCD ATPase subunit
VSRDDEAQEKIFELFCRHPLWTIDQKKDHMLISAPDTQKHAALMHLIFPNNDYQLYNDRAKAEQLRLTEEIAKIRAKISSKTKLINHVTKTNGLTPVHFELIESLDELEAKIVGLEDQIAQAKSHNLAISNHHKAVSALEAKLAARVASQPKAESQLSQAKDNQAQAEVKVEQVLANLAELKVQPISTKAAIEKQLADQLSQRDNAKRVAAELTTAENHLTRVSREVTALDNQLISLHKIKFSPKYSELSDKEFKDFVALQRERQGQYDSNAKLAAKLDIAYDPQVISELRTNLKKQLTLDIEAKIVIKNRLVDQLNRWNRATEEAKLLTTVINKAQEDEKAVSRSYQEVKTKVENLEAQLDVQTKLLSQLKIQLHQAEFVESCQRLTCPHCQETCALTDDGLITLDELPELQSSRRELSSQVRTTEAEVKKMETRLRTLKSEFDRHSLSLKKLETIISNNNQTLKRLEGDLAHQDFSKEITTLTKQIQAHKSATKSLEDLDRIEWIEVVNLDEDVKARKHQSQVMTLTKNRDKLTTQLEAWRSKVEELKVKVDLVDPDSFTRTINQLEKQLLGIDHEVASRKLAIKKLELELAQAKDDVKSQTATINLLTSHLIFTQQLEQELVNLKSHELTSQKVISVVSLQKLLTKRKLRHSRVVQAKSIQGSKLSADKLTEELDILNEELSQANDIVTELSSFKYMLVDHYTGSLSKISSEILRVTFNDPISLNIQTVKQQKNKTKKNKINLEVRYRNEIVEYTSLSGGERERLSLALIMSLAITEPKRFPLLLIDEVLCSLDNVARNRCLNCLRNNAMLNPILKLVKPLLEKVIIVMTLHNTPKNYFNQTIDIGDVKELD